MSDSRNNPRPINNTDHLIPLANRLLATAGRVAWQGIRLMAGIVVRIPRWFMRANGRRDDASRRPRWRHPVRPADANRRLRHKRPPSISVQENLQDH